MSGVCSLEQLRRAREYLAPLVAGESLELSDSTLTGGYLPLAGLLCEWSRRKRTTVIGVAGPPGAGKTTLGRILECLLPNMFGRSAISVSIDDFYLCPEERRAAGFKWRAVPGTHDLELLHGFLEQTSADDTRLVVPRYDVALDRRLPPEVLERPNVVVFEGWFVGTSIAGYSVLRSTLDALVYLDVSDEVAYKGRIRRVKKRAAALFHSGTTIDEVGTFWERAMAFWYEVQLPGIRLWVEPLKGEADIVIGLDEEHQISDLGFREPCEPVSSGRRLH